MTRAKTPSPVKVTGTCPEAKTWTYVVRAQLSASLFLDSGSAGSPVSAWAGLWGRWGAGGRAVGLGLCPGEPRPVQGANLPCHRPLTSLNPLDGWCPQEGFQVSRACMLPTLGVTVVSVPVQMGTGEASLHMRQGLRRRGRPAG